MKDNRKYRWGSARTCIAQCEMKDTYIDLEDHFYLCDILILKNSQDCKITLIPDQEYILKNKVKTPNVEYYAGSYYANHFFLKQSDQKFLLPVITSERKDLYYLIENSLRGELCYASIRYKQRNLIKSNRNQIVFTIFRLNWNQTDVHSISNQSQNGKYNLISVRFDKITKRFHCVHLD